MDLLQAAFLIVLHRSGRSNKQKWKCWILVIPVFNAFGDTVYREIFKHRNKFGSSISFACQSKTGLAASSVYQFISKAKNSFLNIAIRVSFSSSNEWTVFSSAYFEKIKRAIKSVEGNRSIHDLSSAVYPWFKAFARFSSIFLAVKSLC